MGLTVIPCGRPSARCQQCERCRHRSAWGFLPHGAAALAVISLGGEFAGAQMTGVTGAHDPSTLVKDGTRYYYFATGDGIVSRSSSNKVSWSAGPNVFSTPPAWTTRDVPLFTGTFWAPDVIYLNSQYYLYYSVSSWGSQVSAIGLATSPTLNPNSSNYGWTDQGAVIESTNGSAYNTIDPSVFKDPDTGRMWMTFGSYWNGIYVAELNPSTGKRLNTTTTRLANNTAGIEASALIKHNGFYYLFVNWGTCCQGVNSTYNIRVGRSTSPTGPFYDQSGVNMINTGGTLFLGNDANRIGPGHFSLYSEGDQDWFGYHFYDANNNGTPTYNLHSLYWDSNDWPSYTAINTNWIGTTNANWSLAANWSAGVPNGKGHTANLQSITSGQYAVNIDGGAKTVGSLSLYSAASYTIGTNSGNALIMDSTSGDAVITVLGGSHTIAAPISLNDNLTVNVAPLNSALAMTGTLSSAGKTIAKSGLGVAQLEAVQANVLSITAGAVRISAKASPNITAGTSVVSTLAIASGASLDLTNNSLVIDYTGSVGTLVNDTLSRIQNGTITSSSADAFRRLGYGDNALVGLSTFGGVTVDASSILIKYTYAGDANLDGKVDVTDLGALATSWQTSAVWTGGDFNYDGFVDVTDLGILATNWQAGSVNPLGQGSFQAALAAVGLGGASVPEPVCAVNAFAAAIVLASRRRVRRWPAARSC